MENQTLFESGEIIEIRTRDDSYSKEHWVLGMVSGTQLFAAIPRANLKRVVMIPFHVITQIEVEYAQEQANISSE